MARWRRSLADNCPAKIIGISTFSSAVSEDNKLNVWNTKPLRWVLVLVQQGDTKVSLRTYISCSLKYDNTLSVVFELMPSAECHITLVCHNRIEQCALTCAWQLHLTLRGLVNCTNDIQQRSFATTRQAIYNDELAALDAERDTSVWQLERVLTKYYSRSKIPERRDTFNTQQIRLMNIVHFDN